ncbi:MAG: TolB family protein [Anaerolineae bacterium]
MSKGSVMRRAERLSRSFWVLVVFLVAGCATASNAVPTALVTPTVAVSQQPTPTARLASLVPTARPEATRPLAETPTPASTPTPATSPAPVWTPSLVNQVLARGSVRIVLQGLVDRDPPALWATQFTEEARRAYEEMLMGRFAASSPHLSRFEVGPATLLPDGRGYQVPATLHETLADGTLVGSQDVTFEVIRRGHVWLIDRIELGAYREARSAVSAQEQPLTPTPTSGPTGRIVFEDAPGGNLYVVGADGMGPRRLTQGMDPAWSPDGEWVAFVRWQERPGLYLIRADGSGERLLCGAPQVRTPTWSPDGEQIAFAIQKGGKPEREYRFGNRVFILPADPYWRLALVEVDTGAYRDLPSDFHSLAPAWSPDGEWLVYAGDPGLQRLEVASGAQKLAAEGLHLAAPAWSPDGRWIVYQAYEHDHWDLFVRPAWSGEATPLTPPSALAGEAPDNVSPTFSPDGQWIAFASNRGGAWDFYLVRPDGTGLRPLFPGGLPGGITLRYDAGTQRALDWGW